MVLTDAQRDEGVEEWRPCLAGGVIVFGGAAAIVLGAVQGTLLNVVAVLGVTLFVAGLVDGAGRYRGSGVSLLVVFFSAKVILEHTNEAPSGFLRGVAYGLLMALYGMYVLARRWPRSRRGRELAAARNEAG